MSLTATTLKAEDGTPESVTSAPKADTHGDGEACQVEADLIARIAAAEAALAAQRAVSAGLEAEIAAMEALYRQPAPQAREAPAAIWLGQPCSLERAVA